MNEALIIQGLWIGAKLTPVERLCIQSFLSNGHPFHLYVYGQVENVPEGTEIKDANEIIEESKVFRINGGVALFADYFRFKLLWEKGGVWVDMDVICLKRLEWKEDVILAGEMKGSLSIGFIRITPHHELIKALFERAMNPPYRYLNTSFSENFISYRLGKGYKRIYRWIVNLMEHDQYGRIRRYSKLANWGALLGPLALTEVFRKWEGHALVLEPEEVYPVSYKNWKLIFKENGMSEIDLRRSAMIHLWNEMMSRDRNFDKFATPGPGSLYEALCRKYGISWD